MFGRLSRVSAGIYRDISGEVYRLMPVDREYSCAKKPIYYLQKIKDKKAIYISGVFATGKPDVFSADIKDRLGVKRLIEIEAVGNGEELIIRPKKR